MEEANIRERIMDAAERRARAGGYNGFSFRDIATDVGIRSASIHYHFPTKADLAAALARRYSARMAEVLGDPGTLSPNEAAARLAQVFRAALASGDGMCLCGLFGAERDALPPAVLLEVAAFFRMALGYLAAAFGPAWQGEPPAAVLARFEGGLIIARALREPELFEQAADLRRLGVKFDM